MALLDETALSVNAEFVARIKAACVRVAIDINGDVAIPPGDKRRAMARYVLLQPDQVAPRVAQVAAAFGATAGASDAVLLGELAARWTTISELLIYP